MPKQLNHLVFVEATHSKSQFKFIQHTLRMMSEFLIWNSFGIGFSVVGHQRINASSGCENGRSSSISTKNQTESQLNIVLLFES